MEKFKDNRAEKNKAVGVGLTGLIGFTRTLKFTPTELMNGGFSCENLAEKNVDLKNFYLNDKRFFLQQDNHLYHPVKSVKAELSKIQTQYNE